MTFQCKAVLKELRKLVKNTEDVFSYEIGTNNFYLDETGDTYDYSKYNKEISSIITLLVNEGFITPAYNHYSFQLTQKGLHPYQLTFETAMTYLSDKFIDILAIVISLLALLNSYGYDLLTPIINLCKNILKL